MNLRSLWVILNMRIKPGIIPILGFLVFILHFPALGKTGSVSIKKFEKQYGIIRESSLFPSEKPDASSKKSAILLFGHLVKIKTVINPAIKNNLSGLKEWINIFSKKHGPGFVRKDSVLLLDKNQKRLWQSDYTPYRIKSDDTPYFIANHKRYTTIRDQKFPLNKKGYTLKKGSIIWVEGISKKNLFFRDLRKSQFYILCIISKNRAEKIVTVQEQWK